MAWTSPRSCKVACSEPLSLRSVQAPRILFCTEFVLDPGPGSRKRDSRREDHFDAKRMTSPAERIMWTLLAARRMLQGLLVRTCAATSPSCCQQSLASPLIQSNREDSLRVPLQGEEPRLPPHHQPVLPSRTEQTLSEGNLSSPLALPLAFQAASCGADGHDRFLHSPRARSHNIVARAQSIRAATGPHMNLPVLSRCCPLAAVEQCKRHCGSLAWARGRRRLSTLMQHFFPHFAPESLLRWLLRGQSHRPRP